MRPSTVGLPRLSSTNPPDTLMDSFSYEMGAALRRRADPVTDLIALPHFIETALYEPTLGYYRQASRKRVGREPDSDFYTAASLGEVFGRLVLEAALNCLPFAPQETVFVEFGPESSAGVLGTLPTPFKEIRLVRPSEDIDIPSPAVLFSNELFDAQPFRRFRFDGQAWQEAFVRILPQRSGPPLYEWAYAPPAPDAPKLPANASIGYTVDWPSGALHLLQRLCSPAWEGLFLAFDYGLPLETILHDRPSGTARAYSRHRIEGDILASPGTRDITIHVAWDVLKATLRQQGFDEPDLLRQEAFFMGHAPATIGEIVRSHPAAFSAQRLTLMELLHPNNLGSRFQVLHARRILS